MNRAAIREIFNEFCKEHNLTRRIMNKTEAQLGVYWENGKKGLNAHMSAIMIAEFKCGHNLLTSTSNLGRLKEKQQNKACPYCRKAYYFNHTNMNDWELYGAHSFQTRTMNSKLLHKLKPPDQIPKEIYDSQDDLIGQVIKAAARFKELGKPRHTHYREPQEAGMAIYLFVNDDIYGRIGKSVNLAFRWGVLSHYTNFDPNECRAVVFPVKNTTYDTRLREIETELIQEFRFADGLGLNVSGAVPDKFKWIV